MINYYKVLIDKKEYFVNDDERVAIVKVLQSQDHRPLILRNGQLVIHTSKIKLIEFDSDYTRQNQNLLALPEPILEVADAQSKRIKLFFDRTRSEFYQKMGWN